MQDKIDAITGIDKIEIVTECQEVDPKVDPKTNICQKKGPGKGHMKGKKLSEETKQKLREKALLREQNKKIKKEIAEINTGKARKVAK